MKCSLKKILKNRELLIYAAITVIFFGVLFKIEYATDTYATFSFSIKELCNQFVSCGRFFIVLTGSLLKILNLNDNVCYFISFIFAIVCMVISQYKLYNIIKEDIKCNGLRIIIPTLIILNVFSIELFLFIEKGIMIFSVLMCICALEDIIKLFEKDEKKYIVYALIYMLFANFSYQGVTGIFIAISIIYILKYSKTIKEFLKNNIIVAFIYGFPALVDYILIKILTVGSRVSGEIIWLDSLKKIIKGTVNMVGTTYNLLPNYLYLGLLTTIILILLLQIIAKNNKKIIEILKIVYIFTGVMVVTVIPQIMQNTDFIWLVPRSTYSFAALYGILVLYLLMNYDVYTFIKKFIFALSIVLIVFQLYSFNRISIDRYKVNVLDYEITKKVCEYIDEYEFQTGNKIEKIALYKDQSPEYSYSGIFTNGDINIKAFAKDWSILYIINYYYDRMLIPVQIDEEKQEEFNKINWTTFDSKQIIFEDNTLHLCMY